MVVLYGIHAVSEALKSASRSFDYVGIARERHDQRVQRIIEDCRASGVQVRFLPREQIDRIANTNTHQGVIAVTTGKQYADVDTLLEQRRGEYSFLVVLDGVEDPHNLGALIRSADGAGADGAIIPERRAAGLTGTAVKASAGASEHLPIARVTNISRTLDELKERNVWIVGLDERGTQSYDELDYNMNCAIVLGAEGKGLHDLVRKRCDFLVSIPMMGEVASLNVSVAGGVVMYEVARQRRAASQNREGQAVEMMRRLLVALALLALTLPAAAIDRQALTITRYHLDVQMDRASHVMAVTGKITLRNDSRQPQKVLTLQISSSLTWNVILLDDKPVPWMAEDYTSDIDHTGVLTEAVVNLPQPVAPAREHHARRAVWRRHRAGQHAPHAHGRSRRSRRAQRLGPDQR